MQEEKREVSRLESKNQIIAIKSLSSLLISLFAVIGIIFTLLTYFIVSPSLASLDTSSRDIFVSLISVTDAAAYNSKATEQMLNTYEDLLGKMELSINTTSAAVSATRQSMMKIQALSGYNLANESIQLKNSEDQLNKLRVDVMSAKSDVHSFSENAKVVNESISSSMLKASNDLSVSISSLNTLFAGITAIFIIIFLCVLLLSAEELLS